MQFLFFPSEMRHEFRYPNEIKLRSGFNLKIKKKRESASFRFRRFVINGRRNAYTELNL